MTYDEFKQNFLSEFLKIKSFAGKIKYANQNLQRIGSGTGRIVYDIDGQKALKLAKNSKGIAQNEAESDVGRYNDTHNIVAIVYDFSDNNEWLIAEKAKKVNENRIKQLTGIPSLNELFYYIRNFESSNRGRGNIFKQDPDIIEQLDNNEFAQDLCEFISNYSQQPGDYGRPSTFGEVLRDGQPTIVLTDYGLNNEVYDTHYSPNRKKKYSLYELYNFNDGNDDILSDIGNVSNEVRHGMWAVMPYDVSDGEGVMNEDFISFVLNRDKYPTRKLPSLPYITDNFHECVNNLKETLNHVDNKKQFYNNLLTLQEYLISQKYYDREPLKKETYEINEIEGEVPRVQQFSLEDKVYATELANEVSKKLNLGQPQYLGGGANGHAFTINNNTVLKITSDVSEADAAFKILRAKPKTIANVFNIYKIVDTEKNLAFFVILQENIIDKPLDKFRRFETILETIAPNAMTLGDFFSKMRKRDKFNYNELVEDAKHILTDKPEANIPQNEREETYNYVVGLLNIRKELIDLDIKSMDYVEPKNLGYKNGMLKFFDAGGYRADEPPVDDTNTILLPENKEVIKEDYDKKTADIIANKVAEIRGYNTPKHIGGGVFGVAYDIGDNKILKVTSDKSEAVENLGLKGKQLKYIAEPYEIFSINSKSFPIKKETYVIILEKLKTDPNKFRRLKDRMDFAFEKIMGVKFVDVIDHYIYDMGFDDGVDEEKIKKYMSKNSEDSWYFNGIINIGKEAKSYGVESMDYINVDNLGYKKDGSLGFFDVGFGNYFSQTEKEPEKFEMEEDGSSNFSTDDAIAKDGFPVYNQNDTSPSIKNDLDANSAMYNEDLEYNYVDDATKDKYTLSEEFLGIYDGSDFEVFKNPNSIIKLKNNIRGIVTIDGDFYVVDDNYYIVHSQFSLWLNQKGYPIPENVYYNLNKFVPVQRYNNTNRFYLGESLRKDDLTKYKKYMLLAFKNAKEKNPTIEFILKSIDNANDEDGVISEERIKSSMVGSSTVNVKKKCKLAGLGNTSVACNQGDINNLEIKPLNENVNLNLPSGDIAGGYGSYEITNDGQVVGKLELMNRNNKYLVLDRIFIEKEFRGHGYANDAMRILFEYADKINKIITLTPDNLWGANKEKLKKWYKSLGFVVNKGRNKDFETMQLMYRPPKTTKPLNNGTPLNEYREQMEKVYGKTGIYDQDDMNTILSITGGDPYTKLIADMFYYLANRYNEKMVQPTKLSERDKEILIETHERLKRYNKNVLPIHDLYAQEHNAHPLDKLNNLRTREVLIERLKTFPSQLLRNLRVDIRKERDYYEFEKLLTHTNSIKTSLKLIGQTNPEHREKIENKIFSSANDTFEAVAKRLEDTSIPYLSQDDAAEGIIEKIGDLGGEAEILYNQNNILVVKINTAEAMGYIGCSSQWCFATNPQGNWDDYTSGDDGFATIVFNFNEESTEPNAMVVVLENGAVYNMYNDYIEDGDAYLNDIGVLKYIPHGEMELDENIKTKNTNKNILITPEIKEYLLKFNSDEDLLRSGGIPTNLLDKAAFGIDDTLNKIAPKRLNIKWNDDMENVLYQVKKSGLSEIDWAKNINLSEPIDVSFDGKNFYIEDGHHRYYAAKILNKPLNINLEIKANPIKKLAGDMKYDDFHRLIWKQAHNQINNVLNEVGEGNITPYPYKIMKDNATYKEYQFITEDDDKYSLEINKLHLDNNEWALTFGVYNDVDPMLSNVYVNVVNKGRMYRVMSTILKIIKEFIVNYNPNEILIEPTKTKGNTDRRRFLLYMLYIKKNLPKEYEMIENEKEIIIKKKDYINEENYSGKAYRVDSLFSNRGRTAGDVVRFERDELGNVGDFEHISNEKLAELDKYPAKNIVWVTKTFDDAKRYSETNDGSDIDDFNINGEIIGEDGDGGYLVLVKNNIFEKNIKNNIISLNINEAKLMM